MSKYTTYLSLIFSQLLISLYVFALPVQAQGCRAIDVTDSCLPEETSCSADQWYCCTDQNACTELIQNQAQTPEIFEEAPLVNGTRPNTDLCGDDRTIPTAFGCVPTKPESFVGWLFGLATSIGGGIAFIIMAIGSFMLITSSGNPEQVKKAKELITGAFAGLLFIIFSVYLLKLIGVNILQIPGFNS